MNTPKLGTAKNHKAAASKLDVPPHEIKRAIDAGCSAFRQNGSVDCDALLEWFAEHPASDLQDDDKPNIHIERAKDIRASRRLKEQKYEEKAKLLWPIEKIRFIWSKMVSACKMKIYGSESAIVAEFAMRTNLSPDQQATLKTIIASHQRRAIKELHGGEWGKIECPHCKKEI